MSMERHGEYMVFVNYTNHPSAAWSEAQLRAAAEYGEVQDLHFPIVQEDLDEQGILGLAEAETKKILALHPKAVLCQGEFTLCYAVIQRLLQARVIVVAACSRREVTEEVDKDGGVRRVSDFRFVRFRKYQ